MRLARVASPMRPTALTTPARPSARSPLTGTNSLTLLRPDGMVPFCPGLRATFPRSTGGKSGQHAIRPETDQDEREAPTAEPRRAEPGPFRGQDGPRSRALARYRGAHRHPGGDPEP